MFKINNLNVSVNDKNILNDLNVELPDGQIHVIMGKNGIGKSTLCKVIMNYPGYTKKGNIVFNNKDLLKMSTYEIAKEGVMLISQNPVSIEGVSNAEALRTALKERNEGTLDIFKFNKEMEEICDKLALDRSFIHKDINVGASGGERKKIELLHMGILKPKFIILDEIDSGLDVDSLKIVGQNVMDYYKQNSPALLVITHYQRLLDYIIPTHVHIMKNGTIIKSGDNSLVDYIEKNGYDNIEENQINSTCIIKENSENE